MNRFVNTRRKAAFSLPQPTRIDVDERLRLEPRESACGITLQRAARVRADQDQVRHALGMAADVFHRDRAALRHAEQREARQAERVDDGLEVADPDVEREAGEGAVGQARAALVVADVGVVARQLAQPRLPDGALEVVLDVAQPVRCAHERRPGADRRDGDPRTVGGGAEADVLAQAHARLWCSGRRQQPDAVLERRIRTTTTSKERTMDELKPAAELAAACATAP